MDIGTLIQVVATIDAEIKSDREYLASEEAESLSFEEQHAIEAVIFRYERLSEHFQGYIEAMVSAMESAQGM